MSVIARGTKSIRKQDVAEQKSVALSFKKIVFAHKANAGETGINVTSLVVPPEMTANGFTNPSLSSITRTNIYQHKNNVKIVSSLSGALMPYLSYTVNSSTYIAFIGFTAAQDEIFTVYLDEVPTTSLSVVDGAPIIASGTLLAGQTDFNIGTPIEINKYASQQIGAVMVYVDRGLQYRKVGNVTSGDGDYIEVPVVGGLGSLIRFDTSGVDRFVTVVSNGVVAERPSGSMAAMIENVQGQIDQMVPTVAALAGVPTTTFQVAPNNVDLKQFGDTVLQNNTIINLIKTVSVPAVTDWASYTPTFGAGFGTVATSSFWSRRVGDSLEVFGKWTNGTVAASTASITVGYNGSNANVVIDTSKISPNTIIGTAQTSLTSTTQFGVYPIAPALNATTISFTVQNSTTAFGSGAQLGATISASGSQNSVHFIVPIVGWSATQTIAQILGI